MLIQLNRSLKEKIKGLEARLEARPAPMAAISEGAMAASLAAHFDDRFAVLRALAEGDYVLDPVTGKQRIRSLAKADVEAINGDVATGVGWFIVSAVVATIILWLSGAPIMAYIIPLSNLGLACQCRSAAMANLRWLDKDGGSYGWARNENGAGW